MALSESQSDVTAGFVARDGYAVWVDAEIHDPTDPDLVSELVLQGEYPDRAEAFKQAQETSRTERTLTLIYDLARPSQHVKDAPLLIGGYEDGRSI